MKEIYNIFTKSPFGLLHEHIQKVQDCVSLVSPLVAHFVSGNREGIEELRKEICKREHQADQIKDEIREHLPKSIFMPVSREDLLKLLHRQDNIADYCEDLAVLLSVRNTIVIDDIKEEFKDFVARVIHTADELFSLTAKMKDLMESSFSGPSAKEVLKMIENVGHLEWKSDKAKYQLVKTMFSYDNKIDPVSQMMFLKIFDVISAIADSSENVANALRLMISK